MSQTVLGIRYLLNGFSLISKRGLRRFVIVPLIINVGFFIGLFFLLNHLIHRFNVWFAQWIPSWLQWLGVIIWLLFLISFFVLIVYAFVIVANLVSAPFNSFLAEKVTLHLSGKLIAERSLRENLQDIPRIIARQFSILGFYLPRLVAIFLLFLVPGVQVVAPVLLFLFNAWYLALTYFDYPTDNERIPLDEVQRWMKARSHMMLGFGCSTLVCSMIPLLNCLVIPAAVAGATQCWVENNP